jgi:hypothetical protein
MTKTNDAVSALEQTIRTALATLATLGNRRIMDIVNDDDLFETLLMAVSPAASKEVLDVLWNLEREERLIQFPKSRPHAAEHD